VDRPFRHTTVLLAEAVDALCVRPDGTYVDCTAGGGGHSAGIAARLGPGGRLVAFDRDAAAVAATRARLDRALSGVPSDERPRIDVVHSPFSRVPSTLLDLGVAPGALDGLLADLGVSSPQLDRPERGFSFGADGPLDMRMDPSTGPTAADLVADLDRRDLSDLIRDFGDERESWRIAGAIVRRRADRPFETTADLAGAVSDAKGGRRGARIHPATKTFQALRIAVNAEIEELDALLAWGPDLLAAGGRWAMITFHSGEDRRVKRRFAELRKGCVCPPSSPICICGRLPSLAVPRGSGTTAGAEEVAFNPRSRSARLRVAERLPRSSS
jgi:16S rRNA (cytosine1402-N4)-methyltransferase